FLCGCGKERRRNLDDLRQKAHFSSMDEMQTPNIRAREATAVSLIRPYAETLAMVAASTLVGILVAPRWGNSPVDLLYLPAVLAAAGFFGLGPGILAAVTSALAFHFYFTQPYHTFRLAPPHPGGSPGRRKDRGSERNHCRSGSPPVVDVQQRADWPASLPRAGPAVRLQY